MALPYDGWSIATLASVAVLLYAASRTQFSTTARLGLIVAAAFAIRLDAAWQISLHQWDESLHAVVAKHLASHPLTPTLYEHPVLPMPADSWTETEIWLHKPPLALWLMAGSLAAFGTHALVMRLPSLLLSTVGVIVTFLVGRRAFGSRVGLLAAAFQAVNGLLVALSSGRRVADHVDTTLVTCVELGVLAVFAGLDQRRATRYAWLAGAAMGLGVLAKSLPAAIIAVVALAAWLPAFGPRRAAGLVGRLLAAAVIVAAPWIVYTRLVFGDAANRADAYMLRHITTVVEGHAGSIWSYVLAMPHFFGELIYLPLTWFLIVAAGRRASPPQRAIAVWIVVTYVVFSLMATQLSAFIAIAAPALFLAQAAAWIHLRDSLRTAGSRFRLVAGQVVLVLLTALPARYLLEPTGALERRDRRAPDTLQFMELDRSLGVHEAVIFNLPQPLELMFYSSHTGYDRMPSDQDIAELHRRNIPVFIYQPLGTTVTVPPEWGAAVLQGR